MSAQHPFQFDRSNTSSFIEDGHIFYSPNCTRRVPAPQQHNYTVSPFNGTSHKKEDFLDPVWWTDTFGWLAYIPLAPYFTAAPFHSLCWLPKVNCNGRNTFQMDVNMIQDWQHAEKQIVEACYYLRLWYGIEANAPPRPSEFGYLIEHKSLSVCKRRIHISREWFVIWFGFLSFVLAEAERRHRGPVGDLPDWYLRLKEKGYSDSWLAGLMSSTVYSFTAMTPCVGVFIELSQPARSCPPIEYLLDMQIPIWLVWTKQDEAIFTQNPKLLPFLPSKELLQDALTLVYRSPIIPSARDIFKNYYISDGDLTDDKLQQLRAKYAPEDIFAFLVHRLLQEHENPSLVAPETAKPMPTRPPPPQYPQQGMVDRKAHAPQNKFGELFPSWTEFFEKREQRQAELIKLESPLERQARLSRERLHGIKKARVFTWEKIVTSGGQIVYARVAVTKSQNEDVLSGFTKNQKRYNAFANEWDACEDFAPGEYPSDDEVDSDDSFNHYSTNPSPRKPKDHAAEYSSSPDPQVGTYSPPRTPPRMPPRHSAPLAPLLTRDVHRSSCSPPRPSQALSMEIDEENSDDLPLYSSDIVEIIGRQYGYVSPLGAPVASNSSLKWWKLLLAIGLAEDPQNDISVNEQEAIITFIGALSSQQRPHRDLWDLDDFNRASLSGLSKISDIQRPTLDLYLFARPASAACRWILGVKSASAALYVLRIFLSNPTHNILTVGRVLISRGVPFHTFLHLRDLSMSQPCLSVPFAPTALRFDGFQFTTADFEAAMVQCHQILNQPQGRAALLMGGILWRIAKQYLSLDGALMGPSIEVTVYRFGHSVIDDKREGELWDDGLTQNEMRVICGSYKLLTGRGMQATVRSWFPPHETWSAIHTSGQCWMEWTQANERWFVSHLENIRTGRFQPLTAHGWRDKLRMASKALNVTKKIISHNEQLALDFLDEKQPL